MNQEWMMNTRVAFNAAVTTLFGPGSGVVVSSILLLETQDKAAPGSGSSRSVNKDFLGNFCFDEENDCVASIIVMTLISVILGLLILRFIYVHVLDRKLPGWCPARFGFRREERVSEKKEEVRPDANRKNKQMTDAFMMVPLMTPKAVMDDNVESLMVAMNEPTSSIALSPRRRESTSSHIAATEVKPRADSEMSVLPTHLMYRRRSAVLDAELEAL